jgi:PST family polysaccharide transporter
LLPDPIKRVLHDRPVVRRLLGNSAWQIADKVVRMGGGVLVSVYVARYLGPDDFGLFSFSLALTALYTSIAAFGLPSVVVRDLVMRPQERATVLASALLLRLLGSAVAVLLTVATMLALRSGDARSALVVFVMALSTVPQAWDVIDYDYQSRMDAQPIVVARNASFIASAALRVGLVLAGASLVCFAWAMTFEAALSAVLIVRRARLDGIGITIAATTRDELRRLASTGWPLIIAGLSVSVYMRVDQIMLGQMLGDAGVGVFSAAVRISEAFYFFPMTVALSVAPALTATYGRSTEEYERRFLQITRLLLWIGLAVAAIFALFSRQIILVLYGPRYLDAAAVLAIHAWAGALVSLGVCSNLWLTNAGYFKFSMCQTLVGAGVNVALNLTLIPRFGIIGAALATCAGQVGSVMLTTAVVQKTRPLFRLQLAALVPRL